MKQLMCQRPQGSSKSRSTQWAAKTEPLHEQPDGTLQTGATSAVEISDDEGGLDHSVADTLASPVTPEGAYLPAPWKGVADMLPAKIENTPRRKGVKRSLESGSPCRRADAPRQS